MPALNSLKEYSPYSYYHVYNRGINKQNIFCDDQDFKYFIRLLGRYLDPTYETKPGEVFKPSLSSSIELVAYCLMPNHFHILLYQLDDEKALEKLFRSVMTGYVMYFNQKYKRVGPLLQGRYKASLVDNDPYLYHISRYIHLNPIDIGKSYVRYPYSSYPIYLSKTQQGLVKKAHVLDLFEGDYHQFVNEYLELFKQRAKNESDFSFSGLS